MASSPFETRIPEGLDKGKHEDIGTLMDSLRYESYDEFDDGSLDDMPHRKFLCHSTHSRDFSDIDEDEVLHDSDEISMRAQKSEEGAPLAPPPAAAAAAPSPTVAGDEEQDSTHYEPLKGYENNTSGSESITLTKVASGREKPMMPSAPSCHGSSNGLDNETHEELDLFRTCPSVSDSEFGSASTLDAADAFFLERQVSSSKNDESESLSDLAEEEDEDDVSI